MRINAGLNMLFVVLAMLLISVAADATIIVSPYAIETNGLDWWSCSWVSPAGEVYSFYQADRNTDGYDIVGKKIDSVTPGAELTVINDTGCGWYSPTIRGNAGWLAATGDGGIIRVVDVLNGMNVVYSDDSGDQWEPRIFDKTLVWGDNNHIYLRDLGATSPQTVTVAINYSGQWMGHPDIDGDYIAFQWNNGLNNDIFLYRISTGTTTQLTSEESVAPHVGGGRVVWQRWDNSQQTNCLWMYDIATSQTSKIVTNGWFNDTIAAPIVNDKYMVFCRDNYTSGSGSDVLLYQFSTGAIVPIAATNNVEWGPSLCGNRVSYGYFSGTDKVWGAIVSDVPTGTLSGTIELQDYIGDLALAPVRIDATKTGSVPITKTITAGTYTLEDIEAGTWTITFSACKWLKKTMTVTVTAGAATTNNVTLVNGDVDGSGTVDLNDFSIVDKNFGLANE